MKVALLGSEGHPWPSINRTFSFYRTVLSESYDCHLLSSNTPRSRLMGYDRIVDFQGVIWWRAEMRPLPGIILPLHGGGVVNRAMLRMHLPGMGAEDTILVNCTSDVPILADLSPACQAAVVLQALPVTRSLLDPPNRKIAREILQLPQRAHVLGFVGRLLPQKNLHKFLELLSIVRAALAPQLTKGIVIGKFWVDYPVLPYVTSEYPSYITQLLKYLDLTDAILWFSELQDEDLSAAYASMDLLVHPTNSIDENFGYAPIEAMNAKTPVVGTAYGGLKDSVVDGETGIILPTWLSRSGIRFYEPRMSEGVLSLLSDDLKRAKMGEASLMRAAGNYSYEVCARQLRAAIEGMSLSLVNTRPSVTQTLRASHFGPVFLPEVEHSLDEYADSINAYVSREVPTVDSSRRIKAIRGWIERSSFKIDDPAWPATIPMDTHRFGELLGRLRRGCRTDELIDDNERAFVAEHLSSGALIAD